MSELNQDFERLYLAARRIEERVFTDEEVLCLPYVNAKQKNAQEWRIRTESSHRVLSYFRKERRLRRILDLGCGNGWFSAQLCRLGHTEVLGVDVNQLELEQADRIFAEPRLSFELQDITAGRIEHEPFDAITINAAVQYFSDFAQLVQRCFLHLRPGGELHIWDSPFYSNEESKLAQQRTQDYYERIGVPKMTEHYFHHTLDELRSFDHQYLYRSNRLKRSLNLAHNPFPWLRIVSG